MTLPGHPDFQSAANTRTNAIIDQSFSQNFGTNVTYFNNLALSYRKLQVQVVIPNGYGDISVITRNTPTGFSAESYTIPFGPNALLAVRIPVTGQYVSLSIDNNSAGTLTGELRASGTDTGIDVLEFASDWLDIVLTNVSVPASSNVVFTMPVPYPGLAMIRSSPNDASNALALVVGVLNLDGTLGPIMYEKSPLSNSNGDLIVLPPRLCYVQVFNTDGAAAHALNAALIPSGR